MLVRQIESVGGGHALFRGSPYLEDGLVTIISRRSVKDTIDVLAGEILKTGWTVFARIDHAAHAQRVGISVRPTELILFACTRLGAAVMLDHQQAGLDLPARALAWEDRDGEVFLTYNDPAWLRRRHELGPESDSLLRNIEAGMVAVARAATGT